MPTLNIEGRRIKVGDEFLKLSPAEQNAAVDDIAQQLGVKAGDRPTTEAATPAPVATAAPAQDVSIGGYIRAAREAVNAPTRMVENAFFMGLGDRIRAGMDATIGNGSYGDNLKREQAESDRFRSDHPIAAPIIDVTGGIATPLGVLGAASKGATLAGKTFYGATAGAGLGGLQGGLSSRDWTNIPQTAQDVGVGSGVGFAVGGALPGTARVLGAGYNAAANAIRGNAAGMSRGASRHLVDAMAADGPQAVRDRLAQLGDDAMLVDAGPAFLGKGQGASLNSDEGRTTLQRYLANRDASTNQRIMTDVNRALGPAEDPQTVTNTIRARRAEVDAVNYPAALDQAGPVDTSGVLAQLGRMIGGTPAGSLEHKALVNLRDMMMIESRGQLMPEMRAPLLHRIKNELDNVIEYDAPGLGVPAAALARQQGALKQMRGLLNEALEQQVPGYMQANRASAGLARRADAVDLGTQYLGNGKTTASPGRFADEFERLEPGEQIAFAKGSRGGIDRSLGTKANDLQALRSELQGEGGWNTAKLATVHGQDAANELIASVERNLAFRNTHQKIVENSQTAQRQAAKEAMKPTPASETALINPNMTATGFVGAGIKRSGRFLYEHMRPDQTRAFGEIAQILTERGPARDARVQSIIDALDKRKRHAITSTAAGDRGALIAAIGAHGAALADRRRKQQR